MSINAGLYTAREQTGTILSSQPGCMPWVGSEKRRAWGLAHIATSQFVLVVKNEKSIYLVGRTSQLPRLCLGGNIVLDWKMRKAFAHPIVVETG